MTKMIEAKQAKEFASTFFGDPVLRMAVNSVMDNCPGFDLVLCKDCKHWHEETGWCYHHSHFVGQDGEACHPWESSDWKMLNADDFCSYGERRTDGQHT